MSMGIDESEIDLANNEQLKANINRMRKEIHDYKGKTDNHRSPSQESIHSQNQHATFNFQ